MAYRKLGRDNKHRKSMLANLTIELLDKEKMITYGKDGKLISRRKAIAFLHNNPTIAKKVFDDLAVRYAKRNGGYTRILKLNERRGDDALMVSLRLVEKDAE